MLIILIISLLINGALILICILMGKAILIQDKQIKEAYEIADLMGKSILIQDKQIKEAYEIADLIVEEYNKKLERITNPFRG